MSARTPVGVLLALEGSAEEDLVRRLATEPGLTVVRRCADLAEVTAAVIAGLARVAVLDAELGVDRTLVDRLRGHGARTIVCCDAADVPRYDALGTLALAREVDPVPAIRSLAEERDDVERVSAVLDPERAGALQPGEPPGTEPAGTEVPGAEASAAEHGAAAAGMAVPGTGGSEAGGGGSAPSPAAPELPATRSARRRRLRAGEPEVPPRRATPRLVVVTGAIGAPGRSTIAINLAQELARHGEETVLIDADLWGGAIAQTLGLLAETAGLSAAVRAADHGTLDAGTFARLAPRAADGLRVLPGLARATRWREVSAVSMEALLDTAQRAGTWVVVEAPVLVPDDDGGYLLGPGRNDVARSLLGAADEIIVVGAGEPIGIERLVQTLLDLDDLTTTGTRRVVVNRLRGSAAGPRAADSVAEALARFADVLDPILVPDDRALCDRALLAGTTWREAGGRSPARTVLTDLASTLRTAAGRPAPARERGLRRVLPPTLPRATAD
ncbi:AAA family ATPase [Ruania zhangjianzhongii]|uniref:AAA family ATPase n=1 Tax=Ruania zhangjianzhongii TaxID=2603206 RepID=UPI0011CBD7B2|nr:P-loop NTPase [Ruania zhangjianzhongii]